MTTKTASPTRPAALTIPEGLRLPDGLGMADLWDLVINYARVSTDEQGDNNSLPIQHADGRRYATRMGWIKVLDVADEASGTTLDRHGLNAARALIRQGRVRALIVHATDRLTRSLSDMLLLRDELLWAKVELHYAKREPEGDAPAGILLDNIEMVVAQPQRTGQIERLAEGKRITRKRGIVSAPALFGFRSIGRHDNRHLVVDTDAAAVVCQIFAWATGSDGSGPLTVEQILEQLKTGANPRL
jgi:DNA invertase Pin-like site-specific DNA recombinase